MQRASADHHKAVADKKKKEDHRMKYGDKEEQLETKRKQQLAREMYKQKEEIIGNFDDGHQPRRIRSLRKKAGKGNYKDNQLPYELVSCTVEWYQTLNFESNTKTKISDSIVSYAEVRSKAPRLLCDFF